MKFIGRNKELSKLQELLKKRTSSLVVIRGRRRIGKSRLITEFSEEYPHALFSGIPPTKQTTQASQLDVFARQLQKNFQMPLVKADDWADLFWHLAQQVQHERIILAFDEISWIGSCDPDFLGKLKNAWDVYFSKNPELILILCGSVSSWIEENILSSTGFLGRISLDLHLKEMPLPDCRMFWTGGVSSYEIFKVLSVTGGVPKYLEEILPEQSAEENIQRLCFTPEGFLFNEFDKIFSDLFSRKADTYKHIIEQLISGAKDLDNLCDALKIQKGGGISKYLHDLLLAGFISEDCTWNIKTGKLSCLKKFRLSDNYLRFYLKHINPLKEQISQHDGEVNSMLNDGRWLSILGLQFENLVLNNKRLLYGLLKIEPRDVLMANPFFQRKTSRSEGCQIDLLVQTKYQCLYICEIKFSKHEVQSDVIEEVREKIKKISYPKGFSIRTALIHVNGVSDSIVDSNYFDFIVSFDDLLSS